MASAIAPLNARNTPSPNTTHVAAETPPRRGSSASGEYPGDGGLGVGWLADETG